MSSTVSVHRCRFIDYTPSAITALAFPPLPLPPAKGKGKVTGTLSLRFDILAVGRTNGNIELHEWAGGEHQVRAPQAWVLQKVLPGPMPSKVDSLVFTRRSTPPPGPPSRIAQLRLFSAGGGSEILEWNLEDGTILQSVSSQGGSVWSMVANPASTFLALGCEDGSVRVLDLADDTLTLYRRFGHVKARLLSIAWGPPTPRRPARLARSGGSSTEDEEDAEEWVDTWLVVGCSDSSLRKYDVVSGRVLDRMSTDKARGERTLVWAVGVLGDGTIVSGDSLGTVKFWDSITCTQLQSFQAHNADVLCLTIGPEGRSVYTSGVDQKVCQFSKVHIPTATGGALSAAPSSRWILAGSRRVHSHDVRALAVWPPYLPLAAHHTSGSTSSSTAPVLLSGGLDMSLVACPCSLPSGNSPNIVNPVAFNSMVTFGDAFHFRMPYSTGISPAVQVAREAKLVLCRRDAGLTLWKISRNVSPGEIRPVDLDDFETPRSEDWERIADMELKVRTNLVASAISSNGQWISASDLHETKLFRLVHAKSEVRFKRVKLPRDVALAAVGVTSLLFTADSSKLILGASMGKASVVVLDLAGEESNSPRILRKFEQHRMRTVILEGPAKSNTPESETGAADSVNGTTDAQAIRPTSWHKEEPSIATTITCMTASLDGQWLASADTEHRIHVFNLDSVQHHCALPAFPRAIAALVFDPISPSTLVIGLANNALQVFDVEARQFPVLYRGLPNHVAHQHDPLLGIVFDPAPAASKDTRCTILWGSSWMCKVDLCMRAGPDMPSKKRRREDRRYVAPVEDGFAMPSVDEEPGRRLVTRYRPMLLVDFLGPNELVVVERPLVDLLSTLPPAFFKPTYGS